MKTVIQNEKTFIEYNDDKKDFYGGDKTDHYNDPRFFNKTRRSYKRAKTALLAAWNETMTMYEAMEVLEANGIRIHSYCQVD